MPTLTMTPNLLAGQHAAPDGPVDLTMMYVMHHGFRRDLDRFLTAGTTTEIDDRARWRALHERWALRATILHHHHAAEDAGLWPLLRDRTASLDPDAAAVLDAMAAEHAQVDPALDDVARALAVMAAAPGERARQQLLQSLEAAWRLVDGHMGHEERDAMALVQRHLTEADWQRVEREHFRAAYAPSELVKLVPWALSGLPDQVRRRVLSDAGPAMRLLYYAARGSFARAERRAFGPHPSGLVDRRAPVAVVGATGTIGRLVLDALLAQDDEVRVLVRRRRPAGTFPPGVTQVVADLHDEPAVRAALTGVRAALYVSPHEADEETLAESFIRAAEATGTRIVFAGVHLPARNPRDWLQLKIMSAALPHYRGKLNVGQRIARSQHGPVVFGATNFFQNDEMVEDDIRAGCYPLPMRRANRIDVRDVAELCARALLEPSYPAGEHVLGGPVSLSGQECARIWAESLGRPVAYVGDDEALWLPILQHRLAGQKQKLTDFVNTSRLLHRREVVLPRATATATALLGRPPRGYREYVAERVARTAARGAAADRAVRTVAQ